MSAPAALPYKVATLLYCFNAADEVLLIERTHEPNRGFWSPPGGKLHTHEGESPYACACREAREELGIHITPAELHLAGIVSESSYQGHAHWLMFLFEVKMKLRDVPPTHKEGRFQFFNREQMSAISLPQTDRQTIWPLIWKHRDGFFAAHCRCNDNGHDDWAIEEIFTPPRQQNA
ncbi:MAG: NUDIX domain-containing protein [Pedosphaera sp.]|nr:NUDIX domain-containing protein [Pedosphaera sp.]